jgi:hypothetical protein
LIVVRGVFSSAAKSGHQRDLGRNATTDATLFSFDNVGGSVKQRRRQG